MRKKCIIFVPNNVLVLYSSTKKIISFIGPAQNKTIKLYLKLNLMQHSNRIEVTKLPFYSMSNQNIRQIKTMQGTIIALIKQILAEVTVFMFQKLRLVGVGYKVFKLKKYKRRILLFKLGYSHFIYFNIPNGFRTKIFKYTKFFICGNSYQDVHQLAAVLRGYREPDPYKGKGVLYFSEKIKLKEGKRA
jgi:large subunit ribosomal protein L6